MQTSPGPKLTSLTQWENTIMFPSPSIGLRRILSASCILPYCTQFPNASVPTSKLNLSRNKWRFFLISLRMSSAATQNAGLCLHCFMLLHKAVLKNPMKALCWILCICTEEITDILYSQDTQCTAATGDWSTTAAAMQLEVWEGEATKILQTSRHGMLGIRVIIIIRSIWIALAESINERPR